MRFNKIGREQALALGLFACLCGAVLAFGGTEPFSWAGVQIVAFLLCVMALWSGNPADLLTQCPWQGPALLLGYAGLQAVFIHPDARLAREHILRLLTYLCIFCVSATVCRGERPRERFALALLGLGWFEALYGLVQYLSGWQQIFAYKKIYYTAQATGTYINPNHFSGLLEMILPLSLAWTLAWLERMEGNEERVPLSAFLTSRGEAAPALVFFGFSTLLLFAGILFSRSRAGILSAAAAVAATLLLWWIRFSRQRWRAAWVVVCLLAAASLLGVWLGLAPVLERYETLDVDYPSRVAVWQNTLALIQAHPLWGTGLGTFADAYPRVQTTLLNRVVDHAHNDYLQLAAEWGVPGAVLLFGLIFFLLGRTIWACFHSSRSSRQFLAMGSSGGILAILFHSAADFNLQIPANAAVLAAILGIAHSTSVRTDRRPPAPAVPGAPSG